MKAHIEIEVEIDIDWDYSDDLGVDAELTDCRFRGKSIMKELSKDEKEQLEQDAIDNSHDDRGNEQ